MRMNNRSLFFVLLISGVLMISLLIGCGNPTGGGGGGTSRHPWIYVSDTDNYRIVVINGTTNTTVEPIPLADKPTNIAASPNGKKIYCSVDDDEIWVIDTATNTTVESFTVSPNAANSCGIIVSPDNKYLYLTSATTTEFFKVDLTSASYTVESVMLLGFGGPIALNSNSTKAYVCVGGVDESNTSLEVIDLQAMTKEASLLLANHPYDITIVGDYAYIAMSSIPTKIERVKLSDYSMETIDLTPTDSLRGIVSIPGQDKLYISNYIASPGEIVILKPSNWPTPETTLITSTELSYPERMAATSNYAYVVDVTMHSKIAVINVKTDKIVKYIYGLLPATTRYSNPVVVYK